MLLFCRWWRKPTRQRRWVWCVRWTVAIRWWSTARSPWQRLRSAAPMAGSCSTQEMWPTTSLASPSSETLYSKANARRHTLTVFITKMFSSELSRFVSMFVTGNTSQSCSTMWPRRRSHMWTQRVNSSYRTNRTGSRWKSLSLTSFSFPSEFQWIIFLLPTVQSAASVGSVLLQS